MLTWIFNAGNMQASNGNLIQIFKNYSLQHPNENVIVYFDLQWCSGSMIMKDTIEVLFDQLDKCSKVILFTTDLSKSNYKDKNIDTVISINNFFPKGFYKKQMKKLAKEYSDEFGMDVHFATFSPAKFNIWFNGKLIESFNNFYSEDVKSKYYCK